jgi:hypothetical protein
MVPGSSAVEHSTVNRQVAGSNPARGANLKDKRLLPLMNPVTAFFLRKSSPLLKSAQFDMGAGPPARLTF